MAPSLRILPDGRVFLTAFVKESLALFRQNVNPREKNLLRLNAYPVPAHIHREADIHDETNIDTS